MTPIEKFRHLLIMAAADDRIHDDELSFLRSRAARLGISETDFQNAFAAAAASSTPDPPIPTGKAERRELLKDLLLMMAADGEMQEKERDLFARIAAAMEIETEELNRIIDATIAQNSQGETGA